MYGRVFNCLKRGHQPFDNPNFAVRTISKSPLPTSSAKKSIFKVEDISFKDSSSKKQLFVSSLKTKIFEEKWEEQVNINKLKEKDQPCLHPTPDTFAERSWLDFLNSDHYKKSLNIKEALWKNMEKQAMLYNKFRNFLKIQRNSLQPIEINKSSKQIPYQSTDGKKQKLQTKANPETIFESSAMRKQSKGTSKRDSDGKGNKVPTELMMIPKKTSGSGGGMGPSFRLQLQSFLCKQPHNAGAIFSSRKEKDGKHHCTVTFQSNFAMSSSLPSATQEEAECRAALEANKWIIGSGATTDLESAKMWFDAYSMQVVGSMPSYKCLPSSSDLYTTHVHLVNNKLFLFTDSIHSHKLFLEATCESSNPNVNVEDMAIKTALQETTVFPASKRDDRKSLNQFCLHNGGTLPVLHTASFKHPKSGKLSWNCSLKSFAKDYLCQAVNITSDNENEKVFSESESYNFSPCFADFLNAQSSQPKRSPCLAEDNAASVLLEKLGFSPKQLITLQGNCKQELEFYAYDMDLSATYHTEQIHTKNSDGTPMYDCVVSSLCLFDTRQAFTVASDGGFEDSDQACESAAKNALFLLGKNIHQSI